MENHRFISTCLLLAVAGSWSEAVPFHSTDADGPHDVRWRLVTGLEAAEEFSKGFAKQLVSASGHILRTYLCSIATILYVVVMNQCIIVIVTQDYSHIWQHNASVCILLYNQRSCTREPLLNASEELQTILSGVCQQLEVQELTAKVQNENSLHVLLEWIILDSCHWVRI